MIDGDCFNNTEQEIGIEGSLPSKSFHEKKIKQNYLDNLNQKSFLTVDKNELNRRRSKSDQNPIMNAQKYSLLLKFLPADWTKIKKLKLCKVDHINLIKYIDTLSMNVYCEKCSLSIKEKNNFITLKQYIQTFSQELSDIIKLANNEIERIAFSNCSNDSKEEIFKSVEEEFEIYIELIRKCKSDVIQIINKVFHDINEINSEIANNIADLLEEKNKKLRSSFNSKNPLKILSKINTRLNEYLKNIMREIKMKNEILTLNSQKILNVLQIPDLSSSNLLAKLGFKISSCSIISESNFAWIIGNKHFKKETFIGWQTYSTISPFIHDNKIVIKILKINQRKEIYFGISKFRINSQSIIDPEINFSLNTMNIIAFNDHRFIGHNIDYIDLKEEDLITIKISQGNLEILINNSLKLFQLENQVEFPFYFFASLLNIKDEIFIIDS